jgi:hypothetical protein
MSTDVNLRILTLLGLLFCGHVSSAEPKITEWRDKQPHEMLGWCVEWNFQTEATARYVLGSPDKKEEFKQRRGQYGPSELWVYQLRDHRTLELAMIRTGLNSFQVWRVSYSLRFEDGKVSQEEWHFHPDSSRGEKEWRQGASKIDAP